ncbi:MAG TPA: ABC transporter ATP-binding protein [Solirubrobacterales bacterium]|nr:ABC transporter ATP-binding protein [Solirubrobacterales bacterium]
MSATVQPLAARRDPAVAPGALTLERVSMRFGDRTVVEDCSFALEPGRVTAMIGPSGCGKSTIGFLIAGYHRPGQGEIRLAGKLVRGPSHERFLVFQETSLMPWMTTLENVMFGPRARGMKRRDARAAAEVVLARVGLAEFHDSYPGQLSGGMQRRAEFGRALVNEPRAIVLDEPFRGLDAMTRGLMQQYYAELNEGSSAATLFITTDIDEALLVADRLLVMSSLPARIREVVEIDLPRPRRREATLVDPRAAEIKRRALELLRAEAIGGRDVSDSNNTKNGDGK